MPDLQARAETLIKSNFQDAGFEFVRDNGQKLAVKSPSGKRHAIFIQAFDREQGQSIKIHTREFNHQFRPDVWIALVVAFPSDEQLYDYLIPTTVFEQPDEYLFFHFDLGPEHVFFSNVEIKVFTAGIEQLTEYAFAYQIDHLK